MAGHQTNYTEPHASMQIQFAMKAAKAKSTKYPMASKVSLAQSEDVAQRGSAICTTYFPSTSFTLRHVFCNRLNNSFRASIHKFTHIFHSR